LSEKSLKLLPPDALILAQNTPKCVWRPGSARTRWGSLSALPGPLAAKGGLLLRGGGREGREGGDGREGKGEGRGGILPDQSKSGCYGPASQLRVGLDSYQKTTVPTAVANVYLGITPKQHTKTNKYIIKQ